MAEFKIGQVEDINLTLDTVLGLAQTTTDLLESDVQLLMDYPSENKAIRERADRLASKLIALSNAVTIATKQAEDQVQTVVHNYYQSEHNHD